MKTALKNRLRVLYNFFALIPSHGTEEGGPRPISDRESKTYRLAVPVLKSTQNLVISRCSCAWTAKKCTKKRDACAELLFCSLNLFRFWRFRCRRRRSFVSRGGSRIFFRRGCIRLLLYFNTNKPHSFFFAEYTSCIRKQQVILGGGGAHPRHPPPRYAPGKVPLLTATFYCRSRKTK